MSPLWLIPAVMVGVVIGAFGLAIWRAAKEMDRSPFDKDGYQ